VSAGSGALRPRFPCEFEHYRQNRVAWSKGYQFLDKELQKFDCYRVEIVSLAILTDTDARYRGGV
jgi:hypothetical protein